MADLGKLLADYFVDVGRTASGPIEMPAEQTKQPHRERGGEIYGAEACVGGRQEMPVGLGTEISFGATNGQRRQTLRRRQQRI